MSTLFSYHDNKYCYHVLYKPLFFFYLCTNRRASVHILYLLSVLVMKSKPHNKYLSHQRERKPDQNIRDQSQNSLEWNKKKVNLFSIGIFTSRCLHMGKTHDWLDIILVSLTLACIIHSTVRICYNTTHRCILLFEKYLYLQSKKLKIFTTL